MFNIREISLTKEKEKIKQNGLEGYLWASDYTRYLLV